MHNGGTKNQGEEGTMDETSNVTTNLCNGSAEHGVTSSAKDTS